MKRSLQAALLLGALAGCAGIPSQEGFGRIVGSWQGRNVNELIAAWGPPADTYRMPDGNSMYTYHEGQIVASSCTVNFTVDGAQRIVGWRFAGSACRAVAPR